MSKNPAIDPVVIVSAKRTAIGNLGGALGSIPAHELGKTVIEAVLQDAGVTAGEVDDVIMGQVLTAGVGQNPARQAAIRAGIPQEKTALNADWLPIAPRPYKRPPLGPRGGVVTQRSAKPFTPVQFRTWPPSFNSST